MNHDLPTLRPSPQPQPTESLVGKTVEIEDLGRGVIVQDRGHEVVILVDDGPDKTWVTRVAKSELKLTNEDVN